MLGLTGLPAPAQIAQGVDRGAGPGPGAEHSAVLRPASAAHPLGEALTTAWWEQDRRATQETSGAGQHEPHIAANPLNPNNAVVVTKDYRGGMHNYLDATTDGGLTWREQPFVPSDPAVKSDTDPAVFFRRDERVYILWAGIIDWPNAGIFCAWSDDGGLTWSPAVAVTPPRGHFDDKAWLAFDDTGGPRDGTIYAAWTRFGLAEIYAASSTDGGATWSAAAPVSSGTTTSDNDGAQPVVLPDGSLIVLFLHSGTPGKIGNLMMARSTDGGATFGPNTRLFDVHKPPYTLPGEHWRLFTYHSLARDPVRGWLTLIWGDYRYAAAEGVNILLSRSTDQGATWSAPARLNDDPPGLVRDQWFPSLAAAPDGRLIALWLDRRDDPANRLYHAYARSSTDGGLTWSPGTRVSSAPSDPNANIPPGSDGIGDYIGLAAGPGVVWGAWVDVRSGDQDIYAARELFTPQPPPTPAVTPTATPTACAIPFTDVPQEAYFYEPVRYLYCRGAISGYSDRTFRPWNNITRGQVAKVVVLAEGWALENPGSPTFADVLPGSAFYAYVETAARRGIVSGYTCGNPEPCDPQSRPYFRPFADITRSQVTKIVVLAEGWPLENPGSATFADVPHGSPFYQYIETAGRRNVISGYDCGNPEPCDPQNRPYFRPGSSSTRGQIAKVIYNAVTGPLALPEPDP